MSKEESENSSATWICLLLFVALVGYLSIPRLGSTRSPGDAVTRCKNNLKQMNLNINSYYSESHATLLPILKHFEVGPSNDGVFGFDANMLSCRAERHDHSTHYVWNPKLSGSSWAEWNNTNSPLIWDATPHHYSGKVNVLFGDGHVEEITPERLKEMTR